MITPASLPTAMLIDMKQVLGEGDEEPIMLIVQELAARAERGDLAAVKFFGDDV